MKKIIQGLRQKPILRYTLPFIVFMLLTEVQRFGTGQTIFWIYGIKTLLTLGLLLLCFGRNQEDVAGTFDVRAILLGLAVFVIWIFLGHWTLKKPEISFNPEVFAPGMLRVTAIGFRILGACLVVPVMEELLWRSFLMRYLIQQKFLEVPLGKYTHLS